MSDVSYSIGLLSQITFFVTVKVKVFRLGVGSALWGAFNRLWWILIILFSRFLGSCECQPPPSAPRVSFSNGNLQKDWLIVVSFSGTVNPGGLSLEGLG